MRAINQKAQKILEDLKCRAEERPNNFIKIDNNNYDPETGGFMPVNVEVLWNGHVSVSHSFVQNGDLMRDPEMIFWQGIDGRWYPIYFQQDPYVEQMSVFFDEYGVVVKYKPRQQKDHAVFAGQWLQNIKRQQNM